MLTLQIFINLLDMNPVSISRVPSNNTICNYLQWGFIIHMNRVDQVAPWIHFIGHFMVIFMNIIFDDLLRLTLVNIL